MNLGSITISLTLLGKCPNAEVFLVLTQSEYSEITTRKTSVFRHFSHSVECKELRSFFWNHQSFDLKLFWLWLTFWSLKKHCVESVQIQENTDQKKLHMWILFTQWNNIFYHNFKADFSFKLITFLTFYYETWLQMFVFLMDYDSAWSKAL